MHLKDADSSDAESLESFESWYGIEPSDNVPTEIDTPEKEYGSEQTVVNEPPKCVVIYCYITSIS